MALTKGVAPVDIERRRVRTDVRRPDDLSHGSNELFG